MDNTDVQHIILNRLLWDDVRTLTRFDASGLQTLHNLPLAGTCKAGLTSVSNLVALQVANAEAPAALLQPDYVITADDLLLIATATQTLRAEPTRVWNQEQYETVQHVCPLNWFGFESTLGNKFRGDATGRAAAPRIGRLRAVSPSLHTQFLHSVQYAQFLHSVQYTLRLA